MRNILIGRQVLHGISQIDPLKFYMSSQEKLKSLLFNAIALFSIIASYLVFGSLAHAQGDETHPHWVGLFPADFFEEYVVGDQRKNTGNWIVPIYEKPDSAAPKIGALKITFNAETGLSAEFESLRTNKKSKVTPHLFDHDYGYGPYFHLTIVEANNSFYKIKLSETGEFYWGDFEKAFGRNNIEILHLKPNTVLSWKNNQGEWESIFVENTDPDSVVARPEQPVDMWCGDESLRYKAYQTKLIPKSDWIDSSGESRFSIWYTRGC